MGVLNVAAGTAGVLGLKSLRLDVRPTTAHLLMPGRCRFRCGYCTRAGDSTDPDFLSRISWPSFEDETIFNALSKKESLFQRICLQTIQTDDWVEHALSAIQELKSLSLPVSVATRPIPLFLAEKFFDAGIDTLGLPLDAASPRIYWKLRSGNFERDVERIEEVTRAFRKQVSTHLMVGLGEREDELVDIMTRLHRSGVRIALFAFTPCQGTKMMAELPPELIKYRRVQVAHYLIRCGKAREFRFNSFGEISHFGYSWQELKHILDPLAFQTSGCSSCNRPFYNERPSGRMYNYPRALSNEEFEEELRIIKGET